MRDAKVDRQQTIGGIKIILNDRFIWGKMNRNKTPNIWDMETVYSTDNCPRNSR